MLESACRKGEIPHMINSDIASIMPYFMYANYMPRSPAAKRASSEEAVEGEEAPPTASIQAKPAHLGQLKSAMYDVYRKRVQPALSVPHGAVFNRSNGKGLGLRHPESV